MMHTKRMVLPPPRVKLPKVGRAQAEMWSVLADRDLRTQISIFDQTFDLVPQPVPLAKRGRGTAIHLVVDGIPVVLHVTMDLLALLPDEMRAAGLSSCAPDVLALTVEHAATESLNQLEMDWDVQMQINSVQPNIAFLTGASLASFTLNRDDTAVGLAFLSSDNPEALVNKLIADAGPAPRRSLRHQSLEVSVIAHMLAMSLTELAALNPGDVIFPTALPDQSTDHVHLLIANEHLVRLIGSAGRYVVDGPEEQYAEASARLRREHGMSSDHNTGPGSLSDPTTIVTIELDRKKMPLSMVESLQAGGIFELDIAKIETVRICANGEPVADGRLVELDGVIGVQVTRLA